MKRPKLHERKPREIKGRDVVARFQSQFRAAGLACLKLLEGKELDRVYCDYHDDFVTRESKQGTTSYHFFQVKTKGSKKHQWSRLELFGLAKKVPEVKAGFLRPGGHAPAKPAAEDISRLGKSIVGKLLEHTATFGDSCNTVTFLTNAYLDDEVERISESILAGDIGERTVRFLADHYAAAVRVEETLPMRDVHTRIGKLRFSWGHDYLDPNHQDFESRAVKVIWEHSEIDLTHTEGVELVKKLLALVQDKSFKVLVSDLTASDLDSAAGISVGELLPLLPISQGAYRHFLEQGDTKALKNASILQRKLKQAGASESIVETASKWKVEWDNWLRNHRHIYEKDVTFLQLQLNEIYRRWAKGQVSLAGLESEVGALMKVIGSSSIKPLLSDEILVGGIMAELVRGDAQ